MFHRNKETTWGHPLSAPRKLGEIGEVGLCGNGHRLYSYYRQTYRALYKWLNRRSQKRSHDWPSFERLLRRHRIPAPGAQIGWESARWQLGIISPQCTPKRDPLRFAAAQAVRCALK